MRMQINSTSKYLQLEHVNLHYLDYGGPGPQTLVLVHGGGANAHWFDLIGPALARSCRVLAVDLRGHGDSSWAEPPIYTFEAHMQDLEPCSRLSTSPRHSSWAIPWEAYS